MKRFFNWLGFARSHTNVSYIASAPPGWSFETNPGEGKVTIVIRDSDGGLQYREAVDLDRMERIIRSGDRARKIAAETEPSIIKMPIQSARTFPRLAVASCD